ncbi:hypothetical protein ACIA8H_32570 [Streptomyces goshikiensis]|uniref:hypothetical protein n=1 Tax=Streptomyces goshikiensis TaxID=1942 RepID=UPI0037BDDDB5
MDVAAVELTSRTLEIAAAEMAARLQAGVRERAARPPPLSQVRGGSDAERPAACPARAGPDPTPRRNRMTTMPPADPWIEAVAARLKEAAQKRAEAYAPPTEWQPIWKQPRKPKSIKAKKAEPAKYRKRLKAAGVRRFYGAQSPRPRPRPRPPQNRIGSAAARRDTRALSRMPHSNAWLW